MHIRSPSGFLTDAHRRRSARMGRNGRQAQEREASCAPSVFEGHLHTEEADLGVLQRREVREAGESEGRSALVSLRASL